MADGSWPEEWVDDVQDPYGGDDHYNGGEAPDNALQSHFDRSRAWTDLHDGTYDAGFDHIAYELQPACSGNNQSWQQGQGWGDPYGGLGSFEPWAELHMAVSQPAPTREGGAQLVDLYGSEGFHPESWADLHNARRSAHQDQPNNLEEWGRTYNEPWTPEEEGWSHDQPELFNPYDDGAEPAYIRIETADEIIFKYAAAGDVVSTAGLEKPRWEWLREENENIYGGNEWGRWETEEEWDDAFWMSTTKASQSSLRDLLQTSRVS